MRDGLCDCIAREVAHHEAGRPARIRIKANSVVDEAIIDALYRASQAGVPVDLLTRGICAAAAGRAGAVGEPSGSGRCSAGSSSTAGCSGSRTAATPAAWIGSADLMHRNLDRRVECLVRLPGQAQIEEVGRLLDLAFDDGTASWWLEPVGEWERHHLDESGAPLRDLQETLIATKRRRRALRPADRPVEAPR